MVLYCDKTSAKLQYIERVTEYVKKWLQGYIRIFNLRTTSKKIRSLSTISDTNIVYNISVKPIFEIIA